LDAIEKHKAAAGEYANAASTVEDSEALRILNLLESYHNRLAQLVKPPSVPPTTLTSEDDPQRENTLAEDRTFKSQAVKASPVEGTSAKARSPSPVWQRKPQRELASSIVSDLATARGILNAQPRRPRNLSPISQGKESGRRLSPNLFHTNQSAPPRAGHNTQKEAGDKSAAQDLHVARSSGGNRPDSSPNEDAFHKFYSTFEGLFSKLSAPLAYAGLPLVPNETAPQDHKQLESTSPEASHNDVEKIFSKAAMRVIKAEKGSMSSYKGVQESFFVVPAGGGTVSYANILSRADRHTQQRVQNLPVMAVAGDDNADQFVDANESPESTSPRSTKRGTAIQTQPRKTMEELELENAALKHLTENLTDRLYEWEKNAQKQTSVLQQSIRSLQSHHSSGTRTVSEAPPPNEEGIKQLQEQYDTTMREVEKYARENEKLKIVVMRYRERWEKLKEGARVRREVGTQGTDTPPTDG